MYQVILGDLAEETKLQLEKEDVRFSPVSIDDVCMFLTQAKRGGIDHVFE